jgi:hypothetical protein
MLNYGSIVGYSLKCAMLFLVPFNMASAKLLQWFDDTILFSASRTPTGGTRYQHPLWPSYTLTFGPKDILPAVESTAKQTTNNVQRMFLLKNSRLETTLYSGAFDRAAPRKKLRVLFAYVDEEQCTSFFDNCYVSCDVTADDVIRMVGIEGTIVRIIDDSFEDTCYTAKDVVFSI